ncbi:LOW QUALITY PROTEIN: protein IMPACT [Engystomops pustulosus]|uniref:LOW QUALITY PROTEIN: protein IMPACT n=1 Tax=Engystomops pustulosus TaxID=76066 RepID=UPI003AFB6A1C
MYAQRPLVSKPRSAALLSQETHAGCMADTEEENLQNQIDEIEALSSIYGDDWCVIDEAARIFCIKISNSLDHPEWTLCLQVILPPEYPSIAPPLYQLNAPWLRGEDRLTISNNLEEMYLQNLGENILYQWVEKIREFLEEKSKTSHQVPKLKSTTEETEADDDDSSSELLNDLLLCSGIDASFDTLEDAAKEVPSIVHGEPISDRRSTFQAHLAPVTSPSQVKEVLNKLYENKKIASATHNIYAYRIYSKKTDTFIQDCEDDGETAAGKRLLHLMQILDARDVLVVVSRWYGGILLGPDRFKHINNCARNILVEQHYTNYVEDSGKQTGKSKHAKENKEKTQH